MDSLWTVTAAGTDDSSAYIAGMLVIAPGDENYRAFPFPCRVEAAYHLQEGALIFPLPGAKYRGDEDAILA